ncbi:MAG: hypothetical protein J6A95_02770 [Clostridia bacterium]|nr:hypothetical protein [Clostridia bacterium]
METSIDSILSSVMGNEELMSKIRDTVQSKNGDTASSLEDVISLIAPALNNKESTTNGSNTSTAQGKSDTDKSEGINLKENEISSFLSSFSHTISKNTGLLIALKPYLSKERCQMIDSVVKISRLAEALKLL